VPSRKEKAFGAALPEVHIVHRGSVQAHSKARLRRRAILLAVVRKPRSATSMVSSPSSQGRWPGTEGGVPGTASIVPPRPGARSKEDARLICKVLMAPPRGVPTTPNLLSGFRTNDSSRVRGASRLSKTSPTGKGWAKEERGCRCPSRGECAAVRAPPSNHLAPSGRLIQASGEGLRPPEKARAHRAEGTAWA
jgi:hypothetical protein